MKDLIRLLLVAAIVGLTLNSVTAQSYQNEELPIDLQSSFCEGFKDGYSETAEYCTGMYQIVPVCPIQPIKRNNISDYKHGILIGTQMASDKYCDEG